MPNLRFAMAQAPPPWPCAVCSSAWPPYIAVLYTCQAHPRVLVDQARLWPGTSMDQHATLLCECAIVPSGAIVQYSAIATISATRCPAAQRLTSVRPSTVLYRAESLGNARHPTSKGPGASDKDKRCGRRKVEHESTHRAAPGHARPQQA